MRYYFAYGSNLLRERLEYRVGRVDFIRTLRLPNWKLVFNATSPLNFCSFANIVKGDKNDFVEGVLYRLEPFQEKLLDKYEALYYKKEFYIGENIIYAYIAYKDFQKNKKKTPDLYYLNLLLDGCFMHNLKTTYNNLVDYKKNLFPQIKSRHKKI